MGIRDDGFTADGNAVYYRNMMSKIIVSAEVETAYDIRRIHPGMHLLQPQAVYPVYHTGVLQPGRYFFATLVCFSTDGEEPSAPALAIAGNRVTVTQDGYSKTILAE